MAPFRGGPARSAARLRLHSAYSLLPPEPRQVPRQPNPRYPEKFPLNGKLQKERYTPFVERYQALTEDVRRYEEAYNHPDPELSRRYYDQDNYYDESDDIIRYVRAIQNGQEPGLDLKSSVEKAKDQSLYARVLRLGYFYLNGASDYFRGDIDKPSFLAILEKGVS